MLASVKVPGSVLVGRAVAAAHVAAGLAHAQVHPGSPQGHAVGAYVLRVVAQVRYIERRQVRAGSIYGKFYADK
jgi:hypothetical protein